MVRLVEVATISKGIAHERRPDEAGADAVLPCSHELGEPPHGPRPLFRRLEQIEPEREGVCRLGITRHPPARCHVLVTKRRADGVGQGIESQRLVGFTEGLCGSSGEACGVGVIRRRDEVLVGTGVLRTFRRSCGIEPIAELEPGVPQVVLTRVTGHLLDVPAHRRILVAQQLQVAELLPQGPGHQDRGIAPHRSGPHRREPEIDRRHEHRNVAGGVVLGGEVVEPRAQEVLAVVEERGGRGEHGEIPGPPEPLVALRAIGRNADEVAPHAPPDVLVEPVQRRVRAREGASRFEVRVADDRRDALRTELTRPTRHLGVPEAVHGEGRLVGLRSATGEHVAVGGRGAAQRPRAQLAVLQHFGVAKRYLGARRPGHRDPNPAGDVLAEVHEGGSARRIEDGDRRQLVNPAHRRRTRCNETRIVEGRQLGDRHPASVVEADSRPTAVVEPGVVHLAVVEAGGEERAEARTPCGIGDDLVRRTVGVRDHELA